MRDLRILLWLAMLVPLIIFTHCGNDRTHPPESPPGKLRESLIKANKQAVETEKEQIDDFLRRHKWDMQETGTGLRYMIYENGDGKIPEEGDTVRLAYTTSLLNGDTVYTSVEKGPMIFVLGRGEAISGLEEGILLMKVGDRAKFIIPSHLAFGLIGDQNKIRDKVTLVYDVKLLGVADHN